MSKCSCASMQNRPALHREQTHVQMDVSRHGHMDFPLQQIGSRPRHHITARQPCVRTLHMSVPRFLRTEVRIPPKQGSPIRHKATPLLSNKVPWQSRTRLSSCAIQPPPPPLALNQYRKRRVNALVSSSLFVLLIYLITS